MNATSNQPPHTWATKFRHAFRGLGVGVTRQNSFLVHVPVAAAVLVAATCFRVTQAEWCILMLCITVVCSAEMFNSAMENMAKAVTREYREELRSSLDTAAAAVLVAALGSVVVGAIIFAPRLLPLLPAS
ncbi:MAG: diacylglycerol kinase [Planctomycetaceae bacterium]|jgi:diacylglycerol kinase|nr:diacylglycerol kinase [Planctomycetaceae bacterium]